MGAATMEQRTLVLLPPDGEEFDLSSFGARALSGAVLPLGGDRFGMILGFRARASRVDVDALVPGDWSSAHPDEIRLRLPGPLAGRVRTDPSASK